MAQITVLNVDADVAGHLGPPVVAGYKLEGCLHHRLFLHIVFETALNLLENIALITLESYACKRMDPKWLWG
jgi:hypothetical protein